MPTDVEQQVTDYYRWIEMRSGVELRPTTVQTFERGTPAARGADGSFELEPAPPPPLHSRRLLVSALSAAAVTMLVVAGLAVAMSDTGTDDALPAADGQPCRLPPVDAPASWDGCVVLSVHLAPSANQGAVEAVRSTILDASDVVDGDLLRYFDAEASLERAGQFLADEPDALGLLTEETITTTFHVASRRSAPIAELRQLARTLESLPTVIDVGAVGDINHPVDGVEAGALDAFEPPDRWDAGFDTVDVAGEDVTSVLDREGQRTLRLPVGATDGIAVGMPVVNSMGLIGKIDSVADHSSGVLLVADSRFQALGTVEGSASTGVVTGDALTGAELRSETGTTPAIEDGDLVLTADGSDTLLPGGIPIGVVASVSTSERFNRVGHLDLLADATTDDDTIRVLLYRSADAD